MFRKDTIVLLIIFFGFLLFSYFFRSFLEGIAKLNIKVVYNYNYDSIITFLSVVYGFFSMSFPLIFSSKLISKLYNKKDNEDNSITQKHRIKNYFIFSFYFSSVSIIFFLLFPNKITIETFIIKKTYFIMPIIFSNFFIYYRIIYYLSKIFIKEKNE